MHARFLGGNGGVIPQTYPTITKKATGYYLQITYKTPDFEEAKPTDKAIGLDIGSTCIYTSVDNNGKFKHIKAKRYLAIQQKRLHRLQRQLSRQKKHSSNWQKTQGKIARIYEKIARQRRAYNHQLSHRLTEDYQFILAEDIDLRNLTKRAKVKEREDGKGYEKNNQKRKSGLNRNILDNGIGQLRDLITAKATQKGRIFQKINPKYTSQRCFNCGHIQKENRNGIKFKCLVCSHEDHADRNAAKNIMAIGLACQINATIKAVLTTFPKFALEIYPSLVGESYAWEMRSNPVSDGDAPSTDAESKTSKQKNPSRGKRSRKKRSQSSPESDLKTLQQPPTRGKQPKQQVPPTDLSSTTDQIASKPDSKPVTGKSPPKRVLAKPQTYTQLDFWDLL